MILKTLASYIRKLKDRSGNYVLPAVRAKGVYLDDNTTLQSWINNLLKTIYPVGTYYYSSSSTSPASLFGGSWTAVKDAFIFGSGKNYKVGDKGGELVHTLSLSEIPHHNHSMSNTDPDVRALVIGGQTGTGETTAGFVAGGSNSLWNGIEKRRIPITDYTGGGHAHNNMPPFVTANIWRRVS